MKNNKRIIWGIALVLLALALILYGVGIDKEIVGIPLYKLILSVILLAFIITKIIFGATLRQRLRIFTATALLFMILETNIALWCGAEGTNLINNRLLLFAGILLDIAISFIVPETVPKDYKDAMRLKGRALSNNTYFPDLRDNKRHFYNCNMSNCTINYRNAEDLADGSEVSLELRCKMSNVSVNVPTDWAVDCRINGATENVVIEPGRGERITLVVTGNIEMSNVVIKRI